MAPYNAAQVFGAGQFFSINLSDGSTIEFTMTGTTTNSGTLNAVPAPAWTGGAVGNTAFLTIPGSPILYTSTNGSNVTLTMSNIQVTPPAGVVSTGQFKFVVADAESSNNGESLTYTTNGGGWTLEDIVGPTDGGTTYPTVSAYGGSSFTVTGVAGTVGAHIVGTLSPTTVTVNLQAGGLQGVMLALQYATVSTNKVITGTRANAADQFNYVVKATSNSAVLAQNTSTGATSGPFMAAVATLSSGVDVTVSEQMAPGSVSNLSQYTTSLTCTNGASGSPTVMPTAQPVTSYRLGSASYGDAVSCTFTNTAKPATVTVQKVTMGAVGGAFTFARTNLASVPPSITTTAMGTATPAAPTAINVNTLNTNVTVAETLAAGFTLTSATCTDANSAVTGNPATFGTVSGNVLTIPAANVKAAAQIRCTFTNTVNAPTVAVQKITLGAAGGAFTFAQTNLRATPAAITTLTTSTAYPTTLSPVAVTTTGNAVTITETLATNFTISSASCVDNNATVSGNPTGTFGTLVTATRVLTIPATNVRANAQIVCTFTNIADPSIPRVAIRKITDTLAGGPFSFSSTNLQGTISPITTVTAGTAAPTAPIDLLVTSILSAVTVTEGANTHFNIASASCTDTNAGTTGNPASFGSLAGSVLTIPTTNIRVNAKIVCTFTNTPKPATFSLQKITAGSYGGPFTFAASNLVAPIANISTTAAGTAAPVSPTAIQVTTVNTQINVTEGANASFDATSATCTDANATFTGNPASFGSLTGVVLTVPAVNVKPAAQINCMITNTAKAATVAVRKTTTGAIGGPFTFAVSNLAAAPTGITTATAGIPAPASPTASSVTSLNAIVQISEGSNSLFAFTGASCTDSNAAVTGNSGTFGSVTGRLLTIPAANVLPASQIFCTFTNAGNAPRITMQKVLASNRIAASDQFSLSATGTGAPPAVTTTGATNTITSAPLSFTATAGSAYTLDEAMASGSTSLLTAYSRAIACTNANALGTNVSSTTLPMSFTAQAADVINCTITNNGSPTPILSIVKQATYTGTRVVLGQTITYTYDVTNNGNVVINNVQVNDMHGTPAVAVPLGASGITGEYLFAAGPLGVGASPDGPANNGVWSTLAPGATVRFTYTHSVTQAEIDNT
jgi:hypothetical protein